MGEPHIRVNNLGVTYGGTVSEGHVVAIRDVDLVIETGSFVSIVGPSGCGKTTLLNVLAGLETPTWGTVRIDGMSPVVGDRHVSYVFARDVLLPWRTVLENVAIALEIRGAPRATRRSTGLDLLREMRLANFAHAYPAQLSQGMRQRVSLARALSTEPTTLLMDEPFSALDAQTRLSVQQTFLEAWSRRGITVLLITHDLGEAIALSDRVVLFTKGPGTVKREFHVPLPRPRSLTSLQADHRYHEIYEALWGELAGEVV